jgi:D-alanyl-D-alanine-carboxypeptidase/D-alanyl-D-alanine-endopeptidase
MTKQLLVLACLFQAVTALAAPSPLEAELPAILKERVEVSKRGLGIVVGVVDADGRRIYAHGVREKGGKPVDGDTLFEIGSVTKVFTSILLADMVERGEVSLSDPLSKYLPADVPPLRYRDQEATLLHLSRHTSGLPFDHLKRPIDSDRLLDAYRSVTPDDLYAFLRQFQPYQTPGVAHGYSNIGVALLGHALARRAGKSYEALLQERVLGPLGMRDTAVALPEALRARKARGHNPSNIPVGDLDTVGFAPTGALKSTANDLLAFLEANMGLRQTPIDKSLRAAQATEADAARGDLPMGLGWMHQKVAGDRIVTHSGGTAGFVTFVGMDLKRRLGVVIMVNALSGIGDIGLHTFNGAYPVTHPKPPREFAMVPLRSEWTDELVGEYRLDAPMLTLKFMKRDGDFWVDTSHGGSDKLLAESPVDYFTEDRQLAIRFQKDEAGKVTKALLTSDGWKGEILPVR